MQGELNGDKRSRYEYISRNKELLVSSVQKSSDAIKKISDLKKKLLIFLISFLMKKKRYIIKAMFTTEQYRSHVRQLSNILDSKKTPHQNISEHISVCPA